MASNNQIGIILTVDGRAVPAEMGRAGQELDRFGARAQKASEQAERGMVGLGRSMGDLASSAGKLYLLTKGIEGISSALATLPRTAFDYTKQLETSAIGMAGIMGSVASLNGAQLQYNQALGISQDMIRKLGDDALRTAASSQELVGAFQALLAPGLAAGMKLDEIRQLTVVGTNAVKSMGLQGTQVVQELRDLVAGGITASSSTLATALGLKDADIAKAKASSEGLFKFLMDRLQGFEQASNEFGKTLEGRLSALKEGATRVAADGMQPLTAAISTAIGQMGDLLVTFDKAGQAQINPEIVNSLRGVSESMVSIMQAGQGAAQAIWENREAVTMLAAGWAALRVGSIAVDLAAATQATLARAQASRLAAVEAAAESVGNQTAALTAREKVAALLSELQAQASLMQSNAALAATEVSRLTATQEGIIAARAQTAAELQATRSTMAQAEAQLAAARAAGAQSFALALVREATETLNVAQLRHAALISDLAMLGRQQAGVHANIAAALAAQTEASNAASTAATRLSAATSAASVSGSAMGAVMGALGGPVGIAITAVTLLIFKLISLQSESENAAKVAQSLARINAASSAGGKADDRDLNRLQAQLAQLKEKRDELLIDQKDGGLLATLFPTDYAVGVEGRLRDVNQQIDTIEGSIGRAKTVTESLDATTGNLSLTLAGSKQAWQKAIDGVKTATSVQSDYQDKLSASRRAYEQYAQQLKSSGASEKEISAAKLQQDQAERALAKQRDDALKGLNGTRVASVKLADAELAGLKAKLDAERQYGEQLATTGLKAQEWTEGQKQAAKLSYEVAQGDAAAARSHDAKARAQWTVTRAELEGRRVAADALGQQQASNRAREDALKSLDQQAGKAGDAAAALEAENAAWGKSKTAIESAALAMLQLKQASLTGQETQAYRDQLDRAIQAQQRWVDALGQADYKKQSQAIEEWNRAASEQAELYQDGLQLAGLTALEQEKITAQRSAQLKLAKAIAEIERQTFSDNIYQDYGRKQELIKKAREAAQIDSAAAVAKVVQSDWAKTSEKIGDSLTDALMRGFESGKGFGRNLVDTVKNMFKTLVLQPTIKAIVMPVAGSITGALGVPGTASAGQSGQGADVMSLASSAQTAYSVMTSGVSASIEAGFAKLMQSGFGESIGLAQPVGYTTGSGVNYGLNSTGSAMGSAMGYAGNAFAGYAISKGLSGGYQVGNGKVVDAITLAASAYFGPIAGVAAAVFNRAFGRKLADQGLQGTFGGAAGFSGQGYQQYDGGWFRSDKTKTSALDGAIESGLAGQFKSLQLSAGLMAQVLGLGTSAISNFTGSIQVSFKGLTEEQIQTRLSEEFDKLGNSLAAAALGTEAYTRSGETASQTLQRLSGSLSTVNGTFDVLGRTLYAASLSGADMASSLVDLMGGLEQYQATTTAYYQSYYTDAERAGVATRQLTASLSALGLDLPATREAYRDLIEAQDLTTASGRSTYAALMGLSSAFAAITPSAAELATQLQTAQDAITGLFAALTQSVSEGRAAIAEARQSIGGATAPRTYTQLTAAVAGAKPPTLPSTAAMDQATASLKSAGSASAAANAALVAANKRIDGFAQLDSMELEYQGLYNKAKNAFDAVSGQWKGSYFNLATPDSVANSNYAGGFMMPSVPEYSNVVWDAFNYSNVTLRQLRDSLGSRASAVTDQASAKTAQAKADAASIAAANTLAQEQNKYLAAVGLWIKASELSVKTLDSLREETVAYYESQKELAGIMQASSAGVRESIKLAKLQTLTADQSMAARRADFNRAYSLALSTTGVTKAGYADQLAGALPQLSQDLASMSTSRADWAMSVAQLSAQAAKVADQLDATAPKNYQAEANTLLSAIDAKLLAVNASATSAEAVISKAVNDGATRTATGLQQIINQLQGKSVSAFAKGGVFTNSVVSTPTLAPMALFGEAGDEAIMPLSRGPGGVLGVQAFGAPGGDPADPSATERLLRDLVAEVQRLNAQLQDAKRSSDQARQENNIGNSKIADAADRLARLVERWNVVGLPATASA